MNSHNQTRRSFLQRSAGAAAAAGAVPYFWSSSYAKAEDKNDRPNIASIGVGGMGSGDGRSASRFGNMVACADVDRDHGEKFASDKRFKGRCEVYTDYRKILDRDDIEVVLIGTPDHWHSKIVIDALKAGKDVQCQKPLTLTIDEGKQICKVVKETGKILHIGTQQRSEYHAMFLKAVALAQSGRLGKKLTATCSVGAGPTAGPFEPTAPPANLDWDFWLGQAPKVPYTKERCHRSFRWWLEYSGGKMTDWGAHHIDIAQWGLGYTNSGPVSIEGSGELPQHPRRFRSRRLLQRRNHLAQRLQHPHNVQDRSRLRKRQQDDRPGRPRQRCLVRGRIGQDLRQPRQAHRQTHRRPDRTPTKNGSTPR